MKRLIAAVAIIALVGAMFATPASAKGQKPLRGDLELTFLGVPCSEGPFLTWAGTVVIDGATYGWADFPTGPLVVDGKFLYFEEYWTIFRLAENEVVDPGIACDPSRVLLAGENDGWATPSGTAKANGTVTVTDAPDGPFGDVALGSRMFWRGKVDPAPDPDTFKATLHIQPTR